MLQIARRLNQAQITSKFFFLLQRRESVGENVLISMCIFSSKSDIADEEDDDQPKISRHYLYTTHFPLYQGDAISQHDCNQRYILLFGVGKERDEKKHAAKKMSKGITIT